MKSIFFVLCLVTPVFSMAQAVPFDQCFSEAAQRFSINKSLLMAIAKTESNLNPRAIGPTNKNGSFDIGLMQINSGWLPTLDRYGISYADLRLACTNIYVGAWIMANNISSHGQTWKAVGAYNAKTTSKREIYVYKVRKNLNELQMASN
ncbi:lytic transglycosylase domain-containing protein [Rhodoferax antarcticus]|nr:lytic transglycosylase domain-containing protein [Rhodoferax antarcticus]